MMNNEMKELCAFVVQTAKHAGADDCRVSYNKRRFVEVQYREHKPEIVKEAATQGEADSDLQLGIYGLAFKLTTGKLPLLSLYFLPKNVKVSSQRTEREIFRIKSGLDSVVDRLISGEHFEPREGMECKWCDYKKYCPVKTDDPAPLPVIEKQPELIFEK